MSGVPILETTDALDLASIPSALVSTDLIFVIRDGVVYTGSIEVLGDYFLGDINAAKIQSMIVACSDRTTALTAGTNKFSFPMPYNFTLTAVKGYLTTAQASGSIFTVDINQNGSSILSTKLTIDNTEQNSVNAATQPVISNADLTADSEIIFDFDQVGNGTAKGLIITFIGTQA